MVLTVEVTTLSNKQVALKKCWHEVFSFSTCSMCTSTVEYMPVWSFTTDPFERELIFRSSFIKVAKCQQKYFDSSHVNPYENVIHNQCLAELVFSCTLCSNAGRKPDSPQGSNNSLWSSRQFPSACSFEVPETSSVGDYTRSFFCGSARSERSIT